MDHHVLAAAIASSCNIIVTYNIKDFPARELSKYNIKAQHPDLFLMHLADVDEVTFLKAIKECRKRLKNPPKTKLEYLSILDSRDLKKTATFLKTRMKFI
jgi:hypothetical protein